MENKASQKQAFLFTIINYVGILIGIISTLFIYPKNKELLGVFRYVEALALTLFPVLLLGASQALINFSPKLDELKRRKLFNYSISSIIIISIIMGVIIMMVLYFGWTIYILWAYPIAICLAFIELLKKQSAIIQRIALPTFFDNIIPKISLPIIFILLLYKSISEIQSLQLYIISYALIIIFIFSYVFYHFKPIFDINYKLLFSEISKKEYYRFSLFAFAGSLGSVFAFRIDALMIPKFISMEALGTFSIGVTLASALAVPATGIFTLYAPIISNYLKTENYTELNMKYKEVSKLLFFIGAILYSCIFLGIENLFMLLPTHENLIASIPVILILGFNVLVNMGTGFNGEIITYSKYYKFNLIAILLLVILNISLNLLFILYFKLGIEAVAVASLLSMVVFNLAKLLFVYKKFKLFPFDKSYLKLVVISSSILILIYFLPNFNSILLNLIYKITLCVFLNIIIVYKLKLIYQINFWINKIIYLK
ncbi:lipopolysaccharide biosynthesis protein [Flavobacterium sp.]|uniref:lipopolysaccharide biosynthesis protein n=1 Tax=Flavobacterium sp. TaxID=239 RepID=UPI003750EE6C